MKEQIREEIEKWMEVRNGLKDQLSTLLLTDIIASQIKVSKDEEGNVIKDYSDFDDLVAKVKEVFEGITIPMNIDTFGSIKQSVEHIEKILDECNYSLRTLTWVNELENKEKEVEKDA